MTNVMAINYNWNEEVVTQFYTNLYIRCETRTFHWLLQGKPLFLSYERFAQILGFGEEDLARPKLHGGEFLLDSEMAFMYDSVGHTPRVLMQGRRKSRRRTPTRIPLYSY
jgi:hypothetical protein